MRCQCTLDAEAVRRCRIRVSRAVAWSCNGLHPVAGATLGGPGVEARNPAPAGRSETFRERIGAGTEDPRARGSLPSINPCGEGFFAAEPAPKRLRSDGG